jgi:hypothetical protein
MDATCRRCGHPSPDGKGLARSSVSHHPARGASAPTLQEFGGTSGGSFLGVATKARSSSMVMARPARRCGIPLSKARAVLCGSVQSPDSQPLARCATAPEETSEAEAESDADAAGSSTLLSPTCTIGWWAPVAHGLAYPATRRRGLSGGVDCVSP